MERGLIMFRRCRLLKVVFALLLAALLSAGILPSAYAADTAVPEPDINTFVNTKKIPTKWDTTIHVNPNGKGDFTNINRALQQAGKNRSAGKSTRIVVADGIYREVVRYDGSAFREKGNVPFIALEAATGAKPIITGALPLAGWVYNKVTKLWTAPLTDEMVAALMRSGDLYYPDALRSNPWPDNVFTSKSAFANGVLFVGDELYYRVVEEGEDKPGSFRLNFDQQQITVSPKTAFTPIQTELACFANTAVIVSTRNFVLRGLTCTGAGWYGGAGLALGTAENVLIENCEFSRNRHQGLSLHSIKNSAFVAVNLPDNGISGCIGDSNGYITNVLFKGFHVTGANWIGQQFGYNYWEPCATKFLNLTNSALVDCSFKNSWGSGLWIDTFNKNNIFLRCQFTGNRFAGAFVEANQGTNSFFDCDFAGNSSGVLIVSSDSTLLENCRIYGNNEAIRISDEESGGRWGIHAQNVTVKNCIISSASKPLYCHDYWDYADSKTEKYFNRQFTETFVGENNRYFQSNPATAFSLTPTSAKGRGKLTDWQALTGSDSGSTINKGKPPVYPKTALPFFVRLPYLGIAEPFKNAPAGGRWWVRNIAHITISDMGQLQHQNGTVPFGLSIGNFSCAGEKSWFVVFVWPTWQQWKDIFSHGT
jgi:hypothetical protein